MHTQRSHILVFPQRITVNSNLKGTKWDTSSRRVESLCILKMVNYFLICSANDLSGSDLTSCEFHLYRFGACCPRNCHQRSRSPFPWQSRFPGPSPIPLKKKATHPLSWSAIPKRRCTVVLKAISAIRKRCRNMAQDLADRHHKNISFCGERGVKKSSLKWLQRICRNLWGPIQARHWVTAIRPGSVWMGFGRL